MPAREPYNSHFSNCARTICLSKRDAVGLTEERLMAVEIIVGLVRLFTQGPSDILWSIKLEAFFSQFSKDEFEMLKKIAADVAKDGVLERESKALTRILDSPSGVGVLHRLLGEAAYHRLETALQDDMALVVVTLRQLAKSLLPVAVAWESCIRELKPSQRKDFSEKAPNMVCVVGLVASLEKAFDNEAIVSIPIELLNGYNDELDLLDYHQIAAYADDMSGYLKQDAVARVGQISSELPRKILGAYDALEFSQDGISQAANSAVELLDRTLDEVVQQQELNSWIQRNGFENDPEFFRRSGNGDQYPSKYAAILFFVTAGGELSAMAQDAAETDAMKATVRALARSIVAARGILEDLKHFDSAQNQEDTILQNYAKVILYKLGAYLDQNEDALVNMYCGFNLHERENKENS